MEIPIYQIDAFAARLFGGNPAAICPLERWLPDALLQAIAAENNLAETAYYARENGSYRIRWFTPTVEVDLCGHATLAAAAVILEFRQELPMPRVKFDSRSGELVVERSGELYTLDFPSQPAASAPDKPALAEALGAQPADFLRARYDLCVFETEEQVRALAPDMRALDRLSAKVIVTAPGRTCDFVSRFFAPAAGIPEDPVTGSAHCTLIPYWSSQLGKTNLFARQLSARGGELWCEDRGSRVSIGGHAVKYLEGRIFVTAH
jgi:PhzF family phenazine biosynthesis protein